MALLGFGVTARLAGAEPAAGSPSASDTVEVEVFQGARILSTPRGNMYPATERRIGKEGWVELNLMIDPHGKPYEVAVVDSIGGPAFEKAAIDLLKQMSFAPARRGATPTDSSFQFAVSFSLDGPARGARFEFVSLYKKFMEAVDAGDQARADQELSRFDAQNLYEEAYRNYGKYFYDLKWGTEAQQLRDLRGAVRHATTGDFYLPKNAFVAALAWKFVLEVRANDCGKALFTWKLLERFASKDMRKQLQPTVDQVKRLRDSDTVLPMSAQIDRGTTWQGVLFRNRFNITVMQGAISEIKLRCEKGYVFFKYDPRVQYSVSSKVGTCAIDVVGNPGTTFELIQS